MTDHYRILGKDVSRSPSPAMMNAAFSSLGIDAEYSAVSVAEPDFSQKFESLIQAEVSGMNVTIPFKTVVLPRLAWLDAVATRTQAVNTVKKGAGGRYLGHNTDPDGILDALTAVPASLDIRTAMVIGAGGAARAFCEAMNRMGCVDLAVVVRDVGRAAKFVQDMEKAFPRLNLTPASLGDLHHLNHDLVFNASPMGSADEPLPVELRRILPGSRVVFDAVYRPRETKLLSEAKKNGSEVIYGEEMLLRQGMAAFRIWTEKEAPEKVMREALRGALAGGDREKGTTTRKQQAKSVTTTKNKKRRGKGSR